MALLKTILLHVLLLAAAHLVFTQSTSDAPPPTSQPHQRPPQGGHGPLQGGEGPPQGDQGPPQGGQEPPQGSQNPPQGGRGLPPGQPPFFSRNRREVAEQEQEQPQIIDPQSKCFGSLLGSSLTTCNYTRQAGSTCTSCTRALTCLPNNVGFARQCRGLFRYCRNGRCSLFQSEACSNSSSSSAATTAAATTAAGTTSG